MPQYDETFCVVADTLDRKRKYRIGSENFKSGFIKRKQTNKTCPVLLPKLLVFNDNCDEFKSCLQYGVGECGDSPSPSPSTLSNSGSGHKASFRSTKLARRARSFKEDFLEKISQMRSPPHSTSASATMSTVLHRSYSPRATTKHPTTTTTNTTNQQEPKNPTRDIELMVRQVQVALKHFKDVVAKDKLEMLSGNGTIVLDTVLSILSALRPIVGSTENTNSATLNSATNHVYQSLARLIKLCDDVMLNGHQSASLAQDNVTEIVALLENAVQNLVKVAHDKLTAATPSGGNVAKNNIVTSCLELPAQRNSLPDIPLTPRERQILEQTSQGDTGGGGTTVRSSHSTESVLRPDTPSTPPPKPPLPAGICLPPQQSTDHPLTTNNNATNTTPPPLPPKKRHQRSGHVGISECCTSDSSLLGGCSFDRMSFRSRSPEDSSSLLSASAGSLDSVLNHSREEDEIRALMPNFSFGDGETEEGDDVTDGENLMHRENDLLDISSIMHGTNGTENFLYDDTFHTITNTSTSATLTNISNHISETNRLSNTDSGFISIHSHSQSHRNSVQSYSASKRASQQSGTSTASTTTYQHQQQQAQQQFAAAAAISTTTTTTSTVHKSESIIENLVSVNSSGPSSVTTQSSLSDLVISGGGDGSQLEEPPAIPQKTRSRRGRHERQPSPYDNVPLDNIGGELIPCSMHQTQSQTSSFAESEDSRPPPLPAKKRHIMAYMEMFGNCSHSNDSEFSRHSVHMVQAQWHNQHSLDSGLTTTQSCSFMHSHTHHAAASGSAATTTTNTTTSSLHPQLQHSASVATTQTMYMSNSTVSSASSPSPQPPSSALNIIIPPALPPKKLKPPVQQQHQQQQTMETQKPEEIVVTPVVVTASTSPLVGRKERENEIIVESSNKNDEKLSGSSEQLVNNDLDLMEELDVSKYIVLKKTEEDGPDLRGGYIDALIVQATKTNKKDFSYQEAFLTTYRTFISPYDLLRKLIRRHQYFICQPERKPRAREAFALLVRVVNDLTSSDLDDELVQIIMDFIYQLICSGNLGAAKPLRVTLIEKYNTKLLQIKQLSIQNQPSLSLVSACATLLDFKSEQIAEQMTLLDANLFMKIEIPEVLIWAQEQNEERSPNLTRFTEHFNKMSYWARTKILQSEARDREKYVMKFIKIMKHLRKINNFNSYLALLSALDSAPIRRLEWQKHITEGLKEYCALIDSSSSFRAYRQALADTSPPCIPYIGLVLQDLTFVHIGNSNLLTDGTINFSKRWQQFNIVENMKRFKKCSYTFKKNERIIAFYRNFDDFIGEDAMWQISESIKPRGGKKVTQ